LRNLHHRFLGSDGITETVNSNLHGSKSMDKAAKLELQRKKNAEIMR
jgi:hypothetical protein